ncbi:MAG TPA: molybdenum cofactor guanylyltransferase [Chthoniobacterales bacterium]
MGRDAARRRPVGPSRTGGAARRPYHSPLNISAVLLAGGESRRMGKDKATVLFRGKPLWKIQIELLRKLNPKEILVSARSDLSWRPADLELILDTPPSRGPLSGLAAALTSMETDHLLAVAIDLPFMTAEHLRHLCGLTTNGSGGVPLIEVNAEPLAAIYPKEARAVFRDALQSDNFSLQPIVRKLVTLNMLLEIPISGSAREFYRNINSPQDFN